MLTQEETNEIVDALENEYYSLGVSSGHEALANLLADFFDGFLEPTLEEWGTSKHEFHTTLFWLLAKRFMDSRKMWQSHQDYYAQKRA